MKPRLLQWRERNLIDSMSWIDSMMTCSSKKLRKKMRILRLWRRWNWTIVDAWKSFILFLKRSFKWRNNNMINWKMAKKSLDLTLIKKLNNWKSSMNKLLRNCWMTLKMSSKRFKTSMTNPREQLMDIRWSMKKDWLKLKMITLVRSKFKKRTMIEKSNSLRTSLTQSRRISRLSNVEPIEKRMRL